jgi:hypothetical protein
MFFIADADLRDYAYAKYFAAKHGAVVGSVLIGDSVGKVTIDGAGSKPLSAEALSSLFRRIDAENEYMTKYYPWFSARDGLIRFGGFVSAAILLAYLFADAEKKSEKRFALGNKRDGKTDSLKQEAAEAGSAERREGGKA